MRRPKFDMVEFRRNFINFGMLEICDLLTFWELSGWFGRFISSFDEYDVCLCMPICG